MEQLHRDIGNIWSQRYAHSSSLGRLRWTGSKSIIEYITRLICGIPRTSIQEANISLLRTISSQLPYKKGISVACGTGTKEMELLEGNIVAHFDCYELSEEAIARGRQEAEKRNLNGRISFHHSDAFKNSFPSGSFDFIYWDNAMHHMFDAYAAMRWSKELLAVGGCFFLFDFVGPSRFQWTDEQIRILKNILESLDDAYFLIPDSEYMWKKEPSRMTVEEMIQADPSEAVDSDNILPSFKEFFPDGTIIPLGGLIYALALDGILVNIPEKSILLDKMLKLDALFSRQGHNYYSIAYYVAS